MANNTPEGFKLPENYTDIEVYVKNLEAELKELKAFKESIENDELLKKSYKVVGIYPIEQDNIHCIQFSYLCTTNFDWDERVDFSRLKKFAIPEKDLIELYMTFPAKYYWKGHECTYHCTEDPSGGFWERKFDIQKFRNIFRNYQKFCLITDYINSNLKLKLSLIK